MNENRVTFFDAKFLSFAYPDAVQKKINSFSELRDGWHFGDGVAPTPETIKNAIDFLNLTRAFREIDAFPGPSGEISISFYFGDDTVEIIFEPNGTITSIYDQADKDELDYRESIQPNEALVILYVAQTKLTRNLWMNHLSESSRLKDIIVKSINDSPLSHSVTPMTAQVYQYSQNPVQPTWGIAYVAISDQATFLRPKNRLGSYGSFSTRYPLGHPLQRQTVGQI